MEPRSKFGNDFESLSEALHQGMMTQVEKLMSELSPAEIARLLESLPRNKRDIVWRLIPEEDDGEVLAELNDEVRTNLLGDMDPADVVAATEGMEIDDLADVVADLPEALTEVLIQSLNRRDRERLEAVLLYREDSAGGLMNPNTIAIRRNVSLDVVLRYLRAHGDLPTYMHTLFVVDRNDVYIGMLELSKLITKDPSTMVADVMDTSIAGIDADTSAADVATLFQNKDLLNAPVINGSGKLVGQITVDDVVDVVREQAEHDILGLAGLDEEDDIFAPVVTSAGRRAVWLGINLATAFLAASIIGLFKETLGQLVVLAVLMPVVASMGGIAGTQTLTLMVRGMALGRVSDTNARWLFAKELMVGVLNGLAWAVVVAIITATFFSTMDVAIVIGIAVAINLIIAAIAGFIVPFVLQKIGIDPAIAGGVVLTTVTDVVGFVTFLGLGTIFLL